MSPLRVQTHHPHVVVAGSRLSHGSMRASDGEEGKWNREKFRRLVLAEKWPESRIVLAAVEHGAKVGSVDSHSEEVIQERDALITAVPRIFIAVTYADCPPVVLFDPQRRVAAVIHCGWRSLAAGIIGETVRKLKERGARTNRIRAIVGPAIGHCCYEFDLETAKRWFGDCPNAILEVQTRVSGKCRLDLRAVIWRQLVLEQRIPQSNVYFEEDCTACGREQLFSQRRDKHDPVRAGIFGVMLVD